MGSEDDIEGEGELEGESKTDIEGEERGCDEDGEAVDCGGDDEGTGEAVSCCEGTGNQDKVGGWQISGGGEVEENSCW